MVKVVGDGVGGGGGTGTLSWPVPLLAPQDGVPANEAEMVYVPGELGARKVTLAAPFEPVVANCSTLWKVKAMG